MALATRCPNCQILFRVVADQLKLRGGLVRCGACRHVFDAIGSLTYIEDGAAAPPEPRPPVRKSAPPTLHITAGAAAVVRGSSDEAKGKHAPAAPTDEGNADFLGPPTLLAPDERLETKEAPMRASQRVEPKLGAWPEVKADMRTETKVRPEGRSEAKVDPSSDAKPAIKASLVDERPSGPPASEAARKPSPRRKRPIDGEEEVQAPKLAAATAAGPATAPDAAPPEFLRTDVDRGRGFSVFYGGGSALLAAFLLVQLAVVFRTELTTRWPQIRPALVQLCGFFGCNVGWPTRAELLAVVGTELQAVPGTDVLELTAVIRNRANFRVALPAIEVTLTDTTNRTLARKVFAPVDYLSSAGEPSTKIDDGLGAGSDYTIRVAFEARGVTAVGFVVYPFYL